MPDLAPRPADADHRAPATALIAALAIEIDSILSHFRMSDQEAEDLLRETLLLAVYRWDAIDSREIWLLATLRRACLRSLRWRRAPAAPPA